MAPDQTAANSRTLPSAQPVIVQESPSPPHTATYRQSMTPDQTAANARTLPST